MIEELINSTREELLKLILDIINNHKSLEGEEDLRNFLNNYDSDINQIMLLENYSELLELTEEEKISLLDIIRVLKAFENNKTISLTEDVITSIKNNESFVSIKNKTNGYLVKNEHHSIEKYIQDLKDNEYFEEDIIESFFNDYKLDFQTKMKVQLLIGKYNIFVGQKMKDYEFSNDEIIEKTQKYRLTYEDLKQLFEKYNYNIELIDSNIIEKILVLGNLETIEYILKWYDKIDIRPIEGDKKSAIFFHLLYRSSKDIIEKMEELSKDMGIDILELLTKSISAFMHQSERTRRNLDSGEGESLSLTGAHEDFVKNKAFIESLGYDINESYKKCSTIFVFSNKRLVLNVKMLKEYGIDVKAEHDNIKLSGLKSYNIILTLDRFIELDELNYLVKFTSRLQIPNNDVICYRLYKAKKLGIDYHSAKFEGAYSSIIGGKDGNCLVSVKSKLEDTDTIVPSIFDSSTERLISENIEIADGISLDYKNNGIIVMLDENYMSDNQLVYNVGGVILSRFKTIRLLNVLGNMNNINTKDLVLYCLTYQTIISQDEFDIVKDSINNLFKEKGIK